MKGNKILDSNCVRSVARLRRDSTALGTKPTGIKQLMLSDARRETGVTQTAGDKAKRTA